MCVTRTRIIGANFFLNCLLLHLLDNNNRLNRSSVNILQASTVKRNDNTSFIAVSIMTASQTVIKH